MRVLGVSKNSDSGVQQGGNLSQLFKSSTINGRYHHLDISNVPLGSNYYSLISNCIDKYIDMTEIIKNDDNYKDQLMRFFHKRFDGNLPKYKLINTQTINKKNGAVYKNFTIIYFKC